MKIINVLIDDSPIIDYLVFPLRLNRKKLSGMGYEIKFFKKLNEKSLSCDILLFSSKPALKLLKEKNAVIREPSPVIDLIKKARDYTNKIIWMDTSDSTGVTHFELLPHVDLYLKKQLLKDRSLYQKEFYGGRIYTDFYHRNFGVSDQTLFRQFYPLDINMSYKLDLSWNIGLADMYNAFSRAGNLRRRFAAYLPRGYSKIFHDPAGGKNTDIFLRTSSNLKRELIALHRKEIISRLEKLLEKDGEITGSVRGPWLSLKEFRKALKGSKILPSPFGWGELGVRDYEAFIYGAALLKPDISHMETWPALFIEGETYQPISWDFEDMESKIRELLDNKKKRIEMARAGQEAYRDSISQDGMERFCNWFVKQVEK